MSGILTELGMCCGMEMVVGEIKTTMRISREPSPVENVIHLKQLENVAYFKYWVV
jgi:hypothetical protein